MIMNAYLDSIKPRVDACLARIQPDDIVMCSYDAIYVLRDKVLTLVDKDDDAKFDVQTISKRFPPKVDEQGRRRYPKSMLHSALVEFKRDHGSAIQVLTSTPKPHDHILFRLYTLRYGLDH
jgi:hypothetical protein